MDNIKYHKPKNIFKIDGDVFFIPVNTVGVMGAGIAKEFKQRFPELYLKYKKDCHNKSLSIGNPVMYIGPNDKRYVMFPTKDNWRNPSVLTWIADGLGNFIEILKESLNTNHILVIPPLGCGKGKLNFNQVKDVIESFAREIDNTVIIVEPFEFERD